MIKVIIKHSYVLILGDPCFSEQVNPNHADKIPSS